MDVEDFKLWFEINDPERFAWLDERRHETGKSNHQEWYEFWKAVNEKDETYKWTCKQLGLKHPFREIDDGG